MKKAATWAGMLGLASSLLVPMGASAANQLTSRSVTVSSSAGAATGVTYTIGFTLAGSQTLGSVKVEICDSPLATTSCAASSSAGVNSNGASLGTATFGSMSLGSTWSIGSQSGASTSGTTACITHAAATLSGAAVLVLNGVVNPTGVNQQYYTRISTYSGTTCNTPSYPGTDFGGVALSTTQQVTVSANVQESLSFCVYTLANCGAGGSTVSIGTGADNVLSATTPSGGTSKMTASTNAGSGYTITYITTSANASGKLASTSTDVIADAGASAVPDPGDGVGIFGINLASNTTITGGALGAAPSGGSGVAVAPYATANQIAFQGGTTPRTVANSAGGPSATTTYNVSYVAQADNTTKPGAYSVVFTYIATGTF